MSLPAPPPATMEEQVHGPRHELSHVTPTLPLPPLLTTPQRIVHQQQTLTTNSPQRRVQQEQQRPATDLERLRGGDEVAATAGCQAQQDEHD